MYVIINGVQQECVRYKQRAAVRHRAAPWPARSETQPVGFVREAEKLSNFCQAKWQNIYNLGLANQSPKLVGQEAVSTTVVNKRRRVMG